MSQKLPDHTQADLLDLVDTFETLKVDFTRQAWPTSALVDLADRLSVEVRRILDDANRPTVLEWDHETLGNPVGSDE